MTTLHVPVHESVLHALHEKKEIFVKNMLFNNALLLYKQGKLSLAKAAESAHLQRVEFIFKILDSGETLFEYAPEDARNIIKESSSLARKITKKAHS
jgi:predicted HTH domain antitoxin